MEDETPRLDRTPVGPIEPGTPRLENVFFVVLGALSTIAVILHVIGLLS